jgi:hypothetical protein
MLLTKRRFRDEVPIATLPNESCVGATLMPGPPAVPVRMIFTSRRSPPSIVSALIVSSPESTPAIKLAGVGAKVVLIVNSTPGAISEGMPL